MSVAVRTKPKAKRDFTGVTRVECVKDASGVKKGVTYDAILFNRDSNRLILRGVGYADADNFKPGASE